MSKGTSKNESKRGNIRIMPGYTFTLKEGIYMAEVSNFINFLGKDYYKLELNLTCLKKKDKKISIEFKFSQLEKKKEVNNIQDILERKEQLKIYHQENKGSDDPFKETKSNFFLYIPNDDNSDNILFNSFDISRNQLHIQDELIHMIGRIDHIISIKQKFYRDVNDEKRTSNINTSHSKAGIYNRSIQQVDIYVIAYFVELKETLLIPGALINEQSYKEPIPY